MGRPPRDHYQGGVFHAMARGNNSQAIFLDDQDRENFLDVLEFAKLTTGVRIFSFCLMTNHFHFLLKVLERSISEFMHRLLTGYSMRFNRRHGRSGHLFQERFRSLPVRTDSYFLEVVRYIHNNPVKAGLVAKPEAWPWSSAHDYIGGRRHAFVDTRFPLSIFDEDAGRARLQYLSFMEQPAQDLSLDWFPALPSLPEELQGEGDLEDAPDLNRVAERLLKNSYFNLNTFRGRCRLSPQREARARFLKEALLLGASAKSIASFLLLSEGAVAKRIQRLGKLRKR